MRLSSVPTTAASSKGKLPPIPTIAPTSVGARAPQLPPPPLRPKRLVGVPSMSSPQRGNSVRPASLDSSIDTLPAYQGTDWLQRWQNVLASLWLNFVLYAIIAPVDSLPIILVIALVAWTAQFAANSPFQTVDIRVQEYVYEYMLTCAARSTSALEWLFSWWDVEVLGRTILQPGGNHDPSNYTMLTEFAPDNIAARCYHPVPRCYDRFNFTSNLFYCDEVAAQTLWQQTNATYLNGTATLTPNFVYFTGNPDILDTRKLIAGLSLIAFPTLFLFARRKEARIATIQSVLSIIHFLFEMFVRFPVILVSKPIIFLFDLMNMVLGRCMRIPRGNISRLLEIPSPILMSQALPTIQWFRKITCHRFAGTPVFWEAYLMIVYGGKIHLATDRMRRLDRQAKHGEVAEQQIFNELYDHINFLNLYKQGHDRVSVFHEIEAMIDQLLNELPGSELDDKKIIMQGATRDLLDLLFIAMQHYARNLVSKRLDADRSINWRNTASQVANKRFRVLTALCEENFKGRWYFYKAWKLNYFLGQDAMASLLNILIFFPLHIARYYIARYTHSLNETLLGFLLVAPKTERLPVEIRARQIVEALGFLYTGKAPPIMVLNPVRNEVSRVARASVADEVQLDILDRRPHVSSQDMTTRRRPRTSSQEMLTSKQRRELLPPLETTPQRTVTFAPPNQIPAAFTPPAARVSVEARELFPAVPPRRGSRITADNTGLAAAGAGGPGWPDVPKSFVPPQPVAVETPPFVGSPLGTVTVARPSVTRTSAPLLHPRRLSLEAVMGAMPITYGGRGPISPVEDISPIAAAPSAAAGRAFMRPMPSRATPFSLSFFDPSAQDMQVSRLNLIKNALRRLFSTSMQMGIIKAMKDSFETPQAATQQSNSFQRERGIYEDEYARMPVGELLDILKSPVDMGYLQIVNVALLLRIERDKLLPIEKLDLPDEELTEGEKILKNLYNVFLTSCVKPVVTHTHAHIMRMLMAQLCPDPGMHALVQHARGMGGGARR